MKSFFWSALAALVFVITMGVSACGSSGSQNNGGNGGGGFGTGVDGGGGSDGTIGGGFPSLLDSGLSDGSQSLSISPATASLAVTLGTNPAIPTQQFTAMYEGAPIAAQFTIDKGQIGTIGVATGLFTPASLGGTATVTATYQGFTATASIAVKITYVGDGDPSPGDAGAGGAGGYGGVGGQGEGPPATPTQIGVLNGTPTADPSVTFLYPYSNTVFPQAVLPPLLQWTIGSNAFDGVYIHLSETYYEYKGYFAAPTSPGLDGGPGGPFQNHPVPQTAWTALTYSNAGEPVNVSLVFSQGSNAIGPITETWLIAPGELKGTIYYQSYGTKLAYNYAGALGPNEYFGGATLGIKEGQTSPVLVAGSSTILPLEGGNDTGCRVCHSVAAGGSTLVTQHGDNYSTTSEYALTASNAETQIPNNNDGRFEFPALYPDGTMMLSHEGTSVLYDMTGTPVAGVTGIATGLSAFTPAFSPDGTHVAFNFAGGALPDGGAGNPASIAALDFANATKAFSNLRTLATPLAGTNAYWPSFLPTNDGVVFEVQTVFNGRDTAGTRGSNDNQYDATEDGAHGELWWVDLATMTPTRLDNLNGRVTATGATYLPPHPTAVSTTLADGGVENPDMTLNYEPTVNPVPSGGYAWVVFTSRRLYGNVATINPYWSDPRNEDLSSTATPKKLWVAAIDLNAKPGTDPSHPAFYLPAQELLAGNARGFWVVDPCQPNGTSCVTGDECCGGYCRPADDGGGLTCTATQPSCSQQYEKCTTSADCCGANIGIQCIDGFCSQSGPK
jgi:hypothetical protein